MNKIRHDHIKRKKRSPLFLARLWLFYIIASTSTFVSAFFLSPLMLSRRSARFGIVVWCKMTQSYLRWILGLRIVYKGLENIPVGPIIIACEHQSWLETVVLPSLFREARIVIKSEVSKVPLFGWFLSISGAIPLDRSQGEKSLKRLVHSVKNAKKISRDTQKSGAKKTYPHDGIIIFPSGRRLAYGEKIHLKRGIIKIYELLELPVVTVRVNTGRFIPKSGATGLRGDLVFDILPPIAPSLHRDVFFAKLKQNFS